MALLSDPVIVSPIVKSPVKLEIFKVLVEAFQDLTIAVVPLLDPVIVSVSIKLPLPLLYGEPIVTVGASVYPAPAFVI